ncbi:hypothetical protein ACPEIF_14305 [Streptomyces sp. NPDC012600]|uniref:Secreted protein n=3 Tax=Streptomyces TaxID=1883 RepID=A0ABU2WCL1_9ACTN|nr:hypothetical protein [Streptomyces griseus]MDT0495623.1 hypothetical protein [Streptomyces griseus]
MRNIKTAAACLAVAAMLAGATPAQASGASAQASAQAAQDTTTAAAKPSKWKVLKTMKYSGPGDMPLRLGEYKRNKKKKMVGWGWTKIKKKHNIKKYSIVEWLSQSPNREASKIPKRYNLTGYAHRIKCNRGTCKVVEQRKMLLVVDHTMTATGDGPSFKYFGAVTAYCIGSTKCPSWVNTKFRPKSAASGATVNGGWQYAFTYKPKK